MAAHQSLTIRLSSKGRFTIPKSIRDQRKWGPGVRLTFEDTKDGVLVRALHRPGSAKTIEEMDAGIRAEARRRAPR